MAPTTHQFESVASLAVRRRLSSSVATKQRPNIAATFASLTVRTADAFHYPSLTHFALI